MHIYVDADAFPRAIQEILFRAVERLRIPLVLVSNKYQKHRSSDLVSMIVVNEGPDVADDRIVEMVQAGDLVVTADIPLASRVVDKGACALDPRGRLHNKANIKQRLAMRDLMDELRGAGEITGGPPVFGSGEVQEFANQLDKFLTRRLKEIASK
jgi:uncharacterized protein YaiI (UPF0178 family)